RGLAGVCGGIGRGGRRDFGALGARAVAGGIAGVAAGGSGAVGRGLAHRCFGNARGFDLVGVGVGGCGGRRGGGVGGRGGVAAAGGEREGAGGGKQGSVEFHRILTGGKTGS